MEHRGVTNQRCDVSNHNKRDDQTQERGDQDKIRSFEHGRGWRKCSRFSTWDLTYHRLGYKTTSSLLPRLLQSLTLLSNIERVCCYVRRHGYSLCPNSLSQCSFELRSTVVALGGLVTQTLRYINMHDRICCNIVHSSTLCYHPSLPAPTMSSNRPASTLCFLMTSTQSSSSSSSIA